VLLRPDHLLHHRDVQPASELEPNLLQLADGAVRLDAIEQRLARLTEALDRAERTIDRVGSVSYGPSRHGHYRRDLMANALDKQRSTILEGIFKNNLQLQVVEAGLTTKQNAAQTAEAPHSEGVIE